MLKAHGPHSPTGQAPVSNVPLLDVARQNGPLQSQIAAAMAQVAQSGRFIFGPDCTELEHQVAQYSDVKFGIGCASGSDALLLALMAFDIGPGDEVIVPSFTFFATASAVTRLGARPVFVDIDPKSFNIDSEKVEAAITPVTKAIIPVHLFGLPADMTSIGRIANEFNLRVIEDAAQAIGAKYKGQRVGSIGDVGCLSFYPTKNLGGFGDGGMLLAQDEATTERLRKLRSHGMKPRYYHQEVGINSRLDSIQAAVLNVKLPKLDAWANARSQNAARYRSLFEQSGIAESDVVLPHETVDCDSVWNQFTVRIKNGRRDSLRDHLTKFGVGTEIYYPVPLHQQECFQSFNRTNTPLPITDQAAEEVLSLPIFPELTAEEQETVVSRIADYFQPRTHVGLSTAKSTTA